ncbi:lysophospholipid acyltransferase family protein [Pseudalgibacter alginicilyticus]|uniref:lysophospholipid acyltransferase family protein n=1 Tax=Pseudalgibacter alginicilyticus TaxID=1736674 RepID=UPI0009EC53B9|nr:lysophospholipid acyltransferase family protein [Pseudalgibacter alginicilyticus]
MLYRILYVFSLLPLRLLYLISDVCYYLLYYVVKYRRITVSENIKNSFPNLNKKDRVVIEKRFYRNFCDNFIETLKLLSISKKELHNRITVDYSELINIISQNKNCHVYLGHQFNWEWANLHISSVLEENVIVAYKPIKNKQFNSLMKQMRSRFGSKLVASKQLKKDIEKFKDTPHVLILVADQTPKISIKSYWTNFLNQKTAFLSGTELYTASNKTTTFFANIIRLNRGNYKFVITPLFDFSEPYQVGLITQFYAKKIEESINENPENYLWSHRRWKRKYKDEYQRRWIGNLS